MVRNINGEDMRVQNSRGRPDSRGTPEHVALTPTIQEDALVIIRRTPFNAEAPLSALREACTPTKHFYVRTNFDIPVLTPDDWRMRIDGAVDHPSKLSLDELRSLPASSITATLECAGNSRIGFAPLPKGEPWGSGAISTAVWRGVSLRDVLERVKIRSTVVELMFEGADRGRVEGSDQPLSFARSLPLDKARHPDTLLVYEMNGEPLPVEHGGPVRLLVPGWYGMASVKWLAHIAALEQPFTGFFQAQRYILELPGSEVKEPLREMRVKSLITSPETGDILTKGRQVISGVAWSGAGAIRSVEVSVEGESEWRLARLVGELTPYGWQQWEYEWDAKRSGKHVLRARATDEHGNVQPDVAVWNRLGYANNAIQPVVVQVQGRE